MSASTSSLVQLSNVRIDRSGRTILRDVSLQVPKGSITAVLGPSGSGKSTLLAALTGELRPVAGEVTLFGKPIPHDSGALLEMRKSVGVLLQGNGLLTDLTVAENVALPLRTHTRLPTAVLRRTGGNEAACRGPAGRCRCLAARTVRRHGAPRRAGPRAGTGSATDDLRRAADRVGPDRLRRDHEPDPAPQPQPGPDQHHCQPPRARDPADLRPGDRHRQWRHRVPGHARGAAVQSGPAASAVPARPARWPHSVRCRAAREVA